MRILVDTNIFLEVLLAQGKADEAADFLSKPEGHILYVSDFTLHSIGVLLFRQKEYEAFSEFINDSLFISGIRPVALSPDEMQFVISAAKKFKLDFDDAYQYSVAQKMGLSIASFDRDFDRTDIIRKEPKDLM